MSTPQQVLSTLESTLTSACQLQSLLSQLSRHSTDNLQQSTTPHQYLDLLGSVMYCLNSITHSHAHLKGQPVPEQFAAVKTIWERVRAEVQAQGQAQQQEGSARRIDKEAVARIIQRSL